MKRVISLVCLLAAFAGCQKGEFVPSVEDSAVNTEFATYYVGMDTDTKTSLSADYDVLWSEGDMMNIFFGVNNDKKDKLVLIEGAGEMSGTFQGPYIASSMDLDKLHQTVIVYPFAENTTCVANTEKNEYTVSQSIPVVQAYNGASYANGAFPMIGVTENVKEVVIKTRNVASGINFFMKGEKAISKIVVSSEDFALAGPISVLASYGQNPVATVVEATASDKVELVCETPVQLSTEEATPFFVAIAPGKGKVKVTVYDSEGGCTIYNVASRQYLRNQPVEYNVTYSPQLVSVTTEEGLTNAIASGGSFVLGADIVLNKSISINNANFVLDGNGNTITMAEGATNTYALFDITSGSATIKNVTFDGIKSGAIVRTAGAEFTAENVIALNGKHTQMQGLFRLLGKNTITNCTFKGNNCNMVITINYDTNSNDDPQVVENCVFENNICNDTAVLYYVNGSGCTVNNNKFIENTIYSTGNAATAYMGFTENNTITNNIFSDNNVTTTGATIKRAAGALMIGYKATITGNAFVGNTVTGQNAKGNDVCASVYYTDIDLSGNYWGGSAPVENDDYFIEYPDRHVVIINDYLTEYTGL